MRIHRGGSFALSFWIAAACGISGCAPDNGAQKAGAAEAPQPSAQAEADFDETRSRCGPIAGTAQQCLAEARSYATGQQAKAPACVVEIGGPNDTTFNDAWLTLRPNGADPAEEAAWRARRLARFQAALPVAKDPGGDLVAARKDVLRSETKDCWATYERLRGLHSAPGAVDKYLAIIEDIVVRP